MALADEVLADSPLGYWPLDETSGTVAADDSGNSRSLTYGAGVLLDQSSMIEGQPTIKTSGTSTGTADRAYEAWMNTGGAVTVEVWFRCVPGTPNSVVFGRTGGSGYNWGLFSGGTFGVRSAGGSFGTATPSTALDDGEWHHLVGTYSSTADLTIAYVDGVQVGSTTGGSGDIITTANNLQVGGRGANYFSGWVAHAAVYATALSAARVTAHYNAGAAGMGTTDLRVASAKVRALTSQPSDLYVGSAKIRSLTTQPSELSVGSAKIRVLATQTTEVTAAGNHITETEAVNPGAAIAYDTGVYGAGVYGEGVYGGLPATAPITVGGGHVTEVDSVRSGAVTPDVVSGSHVTETTVMRSGTVVEGTPAVAVPGGHATEITTIRQGVATTPGTVLGSHVAETTIIRNGSAVGAWNGGARLLLSATHTLEFESANVDPGGDLPELSWPYGESDVDLTGEEDRYYQLTVENDDEASMLFAVSHDEMSVELIDSAGVTVATFPSATPYAITDADVGDTFTVRVSMPLTVVDDRQVSIRWEAFTDYLDHDDRATPFIIEGSSYGVSEPIDMFPLSVAAGEVGTGTGWISWTADEAATMHFEVDADNTVQAALYLNGAQFYALQSGDPITFYQVPVVAGDLVEVMVATENGMAMTTVVWGADPEPVAPEVAAETIRVEAYEPDGVTRITELPRRYAPKAQELLNQTGAGEVSVFLDDSVASKYDWDSYRDVIKFFLGNKCIYAIRIRNRRTTIVDSAESNRLLRTVSGPSVLNILDDAIVVHDVQPPRHDSPDERSYNWTAPRGAWYDPSDWDAKIVDAPLDDPPGGPWNDAKTKLLLKPHERDKYNMPKDWPDPLARWMFAASLKSKNEYFGVRDFRVPRRKARIRFYRRRFFVPHRMTIRVFASADEDFTLYMDGEEIVDQQNEEIGYTSYVYRNLRLHRGWHTLAASVRTRPPNPRVDGDFVDTFLCSVWKVNRSNKLADNLFRSGRDRGWEVFYGPGVPGWSRAEVLRNFILEGRDRSIKSLEYLSFGFTSNVDSYGKNWPDRKFNQKVRIGARGTELINMLVEGNGFDVWVDYNDMVLHAARRRGHDKSASIKLEPGNNLLRFETEGVDEIVNTYLVRYKGGWFRYRAHGSVKRHGRVEGLISLGDIASEDRARRIVAALSRGMAWAQRRSGISDLVRRPYDQPSGSLIARPGAYPFLDFKVGDVVLAPNESGSKYEPVRVVALSFSEDENGLLTFDPEFEGVGNG